MQKIDILVILTAILLIMMGSILIFLVIKLNKKNKTENNKELDEKIQKILLEQENQKQKISGLKDDSLLIRTAVYPLKDNLDDKFKYFDEKQERLNHILEMRVKNIGEEINSLISKENKNNTELINKINENLENLIKTNFENINNSLNNSIKNLFESQKSLNEITKERLVQIEGTVKEKLEEHINTSITNTFKVIENQLKDLQGSLSQVKELSSDIKDFDKIFRGVKTRGTLGEIIFKDMLDEILGPELYEEQYSIKKGSQEKVDFAIKIPTHDNSKRYFPIDSKFPTSSYEALIKAKEENNKKEIEEATNKLKNDILEQAKKISKYIDTDKTTPFAAMYLPSEGLYADVIAIPDLFRKAKDLRILIMGPSISAAWLSLLKAGFQAVTLQKNSKDILSSFDKFRTEFENIIKQVEKAQSGNRQIGEALEKIYKKTNTIQTITSKLSNKIDEKDSLTD